MGRCKKNSELCFALEKLHTPKDQMFEETPIIPAEGWRAILELARQLVNAIYSEI